MLSSSLLPAIMMVVARERWCRGRGEGRDDGAMAGGGEEREPWQGEGGEERDDGAMPGGRGEAKK